MKKILLILFVVVVGILCPLVSLHNGGTATLPPGTLTSVDKSKNYFDELRHQVGFCESGNKHDGVWGDGGLAYGKYQFHKRTFDWMKKKARRPELKRENLQDQEWLFAWALKNGYGSHWTCYTKIMKKGKICGT